MAEDPPRSALQDAVVVFLVAVVVGLLVGVVVFGDTWREALTQGAGIGLGVGIVFYLYYTFR